MDYLLPSSFKQLMEEGDFADCCVIVGTRRFPCHKVILGSASDFFKRTFQPGFAEAKTGEVTLTDVTEDTFEKFRLYVYTHDRTSLKDYSNRDIIKLNQCGDMWMVEPLKIHCVNILRERLKTMNCKDLVICFEQAHDVHDETLIGHISEHLELKMAANINVSEAIFHLKTNVFKEYLKLRFSTEIRRYGMVEKYVGIHGLVDQSEINSLLNLIDFTKMTAKEFFDGPGKSKLLSFEEKYNLIQKIVEKSHYYVWPSYTGFEF